MQLLMTLSSACVLLTVLMWCSATFASSQVRRMIVNQRSLGLAINAWDGARHGTILRLHNGCEPANPDCTWTMLPNGMIVSDRDSRLAINAWGGAQVGTVLRLHDGCRPDNPDCTWTYQNGQFISNRDRSLVISAGGNVLFGAVLKLDRTQPGAGDRIWVWK